MNEKNNRKVIFSESIDSSINGFALVVAFIGIGIFLAYHSDYFGNDIVSKVIQWIFIIIGGLGLITEIQNLRKGKPKKQIQGLSDLCIGIVLLGIWWLIYINFNIWYSNLINFFFFMFGLYGSARGILEVAYSIINLKRNEKKIITWNLVKDVVVTISEISAIMVAIINILQATNLIQYFIH